MVFLIKGPDPNLQVMGVSHPSNSNEGMLEASACNMLRYMPPHATLKLGSTVGDMMRRAGFTSRLRTLVIVWTRALMLSQAPSVFLICVI